MGGVLWQWREGAQYMLSNPRKTLGKTLVECYIAVHKEDSLHSSGTDVRFPSGFELS